jgi:hypothetical protein
LVCIQHHERLCNSMSNFHEQLLTNAGMAAAHAVLISKYEWFVHATIMDVFTKVKGCGLQPRLPETGHSWPEILQQLGCGGSNIICLSPYPRNQILLLNKGGKSVFKLALHCDALPKRIGFDWSLMGTRQRSCDMRRSSTSLLDEQICLRMIQNSEAVVSYDPIANLYAANSAAYCSGVLPRFLGAAGGVSPGRPGGALTVGIRPPLGLAWLAAASAIAPPTTPFAGFASGTISEVACSPLVKPTYVRAERCRFPST